MWNRDADIEDELDITYRQQHDPPETPHNLPTFSRQSDATSKTVETEPLTPSETKAKKKSAISVKQPPGISSWDTSDDKIDCQFMERFSIGAHLPLCNIAYDLINEKRKFLKENTSNDIAKLRTRKPIRTLTKQEKKL